MKRIFIAILAIGLLVVTPTTRLVNASCAPVPGCTESPGQLQHPTTPHTDNTKHSAKTHTEGSHHNTKHSANSGGKGLIQLPSGVNDFPNNDVNAIQVHVASAKKDIIGSYHVTGEVTNEGSDMLQFVQVTVHFYGAGGNLVADSTCCYTTPTDIDPGHTATFDSFVMSNQISSKPASYRLSYAWNAPTVNQPAPTVNQPSSQSETNFTAGNTRSAGTSSVTVPTTNGSSTSGEFIQLLTSKSDFSNGDDARSIRLIYVHGGNSPIGGWLLRGMLQNVGNKTIPMLTVTATIYNSTRQPVDSMQQPAIVGSDTTLAPGQQKPFELYGEASTGVYFKLGYSW
jgi:hypothetical protein